MCAWLAVSAAITACGTPSSGPSVTGSEPAPAPRAGNDGGLPTDAALASAPAAGIATGWCVIIGSIDHDRFDAAAALAARARSAGFATAGVYDPRDFVNLAWGALAVIAVGDLATSGAAETAAQALKRQKLDADVKRCEVVAGTRAHPLATSAAIQPQPAPPHGDPIRLTGPDPFATLHRNCFAWSPTTHTVACLVGGFDTYGGQSWAVEFSGSAHDPIELVTSGETPGGVPYRPLTVAPERLRTLNDRLAAGRFVALDAPARPLTPGGHVDWVKPRFSVRQVSQVGYRDVIQVRCGALDRPFENMLRLPGLRGVTGSVVLVPDTTFVVLEAQSWVHDEGGLQLGQIATLVDLASCTASGPDRNLDEP